MRRTSAGWFKETNVKAENIRTSTAGDRFLLFSDELNVQLALFSLRGICRDANWGGTTIK
ncbi:hypothetical protein HMPREF3187_01226 [Aerococcus christensenii]|uniref:Uncharacterized protein n=1 Tax=Aerococcus christensenii TaxID=87541 RepID=A0A133XVC9_9LACT|nr:hypothetical protein HMPREF3187_01226 [Aerococcus christensenii]